MNYIITIGHKEYLYKGDQGLATLLKALGNMQEIEVDYIRTEGNFRKIQWIEGGDLEVSVSPTKKVFPKKKPITEIPDEAITEMGPTTTDIFDAFGLKALPGGLKALPGRKGGREVES